VLSLETDQKETTSLYFPRRRAALKLSLKLPEMKASKAEITFAKLDLASPYNDAKHRRSASPQKQSFRKR
jgi:hypothetical protein